MAATGLAAMRDSLRSDEVPYNASARTTAGKRWIVSGNGSGDGNRRVI